MAKLTGQIENIMQMKIKKILSNLSINNIAIIYLAAYLVPFVLLPLIQDGVGRFDWSQVIQRYAAIYETIISYGQIPGNNIWLGGGMPLTQTYSAFGVFGVNTLIFGPKSGTHIAIAIYYFIGFAGALKWAQLITNDKITQVLFSLYFVVGNAITHHIAAGHLIFVTIMVLPSVMYLTNHAGKKNCGLYTGLLLGLAALDGLLYSTQYIVIAMVVYLTQGLISERTNKKEASRFLLGVLVGFTSIALYKFYTIYPMISDFPREISDGTNYKITDAIRFALLPIVQFGWIAIDAQSCTGTWENGNYIGISALILIVVASTRWPKSALGILILLLASYSNSSNWYDINYYIKQIPSFGSHLCTARLRLLTPFFVGTLIVIFIHKIKIRKDKMLYTLLFLISIIELTTVNLPIMLDSHTYKSKINVEEGAKATSSPEQVKLPVIRTYNELPAGVGNIADATLKNIGIFNEQESYIRPINYEKFKNISESAEFIQENNEVIPYYWSPNKIIFKNLQSNKCVQTKIHAGRYWRINDIREYKNKSIYEPNELICAFPDARGYLIIEYEIPYANLMLAINIMLLLVVIFLIYSTRLPNAILAKFDNK
jgi:hypothetical protein